jgi:FlaA1/EpsC-like NDP-sugar epimerase
MDRVFITGGAGYLGRALVDHLLTHHPDHPQVTVYSRDEEKLARLRARYPAPLPLTTIVGDVTDAHHLTMQMQDHDTVIHCAAMKFVPECERQPSEAIRVNLLGSQMVAASAANVPSVKDVVAISTDKACQPINTYGATKMLMERLWLEYNKWCPANYHLVRYGNVIASTGSVVGIWRGQMEAQQQLTITDPMMTRFWCGVGDAVQLILRSLEEPGGTILVPELPSSSMQAFAEACWGLFAGPTEGGWNLNRCTKPIGNRGGEKSNETLITAHERWESESAGCLGTIPLQRLIPGIPRRLSPAGSNPYTSDHPQHWLTQDELINLLIEATRWE